MIKYSGAFLIKIPLDEFLWSASWGWSNAIASSAKARSGSKCSLWSGKLRWLWGNRIVLFVIFFMSPCNFIIIFLSQYRELYFEGGVSSVYLWDLDAGFAGVILIKKAGDGSKKIKGKPWFTEPAMERSKLFRNKDCHNIRIIHLNICLGNESKVQGDETSGNDNLLPAFKLGDIIFQTALKMHWLLLNAILHSHFMLRCCSKIHRTITQLVT